MSDDVDAISRFPGPVVLQSTPRTGWFLGLIGAATIVAWYGYAIEGGSGAMLRLMAFAPLFAISLLLLPGGNTLTLDSDGLEMRYLWFGRRRTHWADAGDFTVILKGNPRVAFNDASRAGGFLAKFNLASTGRTTSLPGSYGLSPDDLADLLALWCVRATAGARAPWQPAAPSVADRVSVSTPVRRIVRGGMLALRSARGSMLALHIVLIVLVVALVVAGLLLNLLNSP